MPKTKNNQQVNLDTVVSQATEKLTSAYELEEDFVSSFQKSLGTVLKKYYIYDTPQALTSVTHEGGASAVVKKTPKKSRPKSAYNIFVAENMPTFKEIPHKERMSKIADKWKQLDDAGKAEFKKKAMALAEATNLKEVQTETVTEVATEKTETEVATDKVEAQAV